MDLFTWIDPFDKAVSVFIHNETNNSLLDWVMPIIRERAYSIPIYIYLLYWTAKSDKISVWKFIGFSLLLVGITDLISVQLLKPFFHRLRPLHDPEISKYFRSIVSKGGLYSFPSSHASNHFGLAFLWCYGYHKISGKKIYWPLIWASLVCYAQIYVGKHYLTDIIAGALFGYISAKLVIFVIEKYESSLDHLFKKLFRRSH